MTKRKDRRTTDVQVGVMVTKQNRKLKNWEWNLKKISKISNDFFKIQTTHNQHIIILGEHFLDYIYN